MFLNNERSVFQKPGARRTPGRSLGMSLWLAVGTLNPDALNQLLKLWDALAFGSVTVWFTRQPTGVAPKQPEPIASIQFAPAPALQPALLIEAVSGRPVWKVCTPENCQPPKACPTRPCWVRSHGSSQTKFAVNTWRRSAMLGP